MECNLNFSFCRRDLERGSKDVSAQSDYSEKFENATAIFRKCVTFIRSDADNARKLRNLSRVCTAGGLAAFGGIVAGEQKFADLLGPVAAVYVGSILGGMGNGLSTWFSWEPTPAQNDQDLNLEIADPRPTKEPAYPDQDVRRRLEQLEEQMTRVLRSIDEKQ